MSGGIRQNVVAQEVWEPIFKGIFFHICSWTEKALTVEVSRLALIRLEVSAKLLRRLVCECHHHHHHRRRRHRRCRRRHRQRRLKPIKCSLGKKNWKNFVTTSVAALSSSTSTTRTTRKTSSKDQGDARRVTPCDKSSTRASWLTPTCQTRCPRVASRSTWPSERTGAWKKWRRLFKNFNNSSSNSNNNNQSSYPCHTTTPPSTRTRATACPTRPSPSGHQVQRGGSGGRKENDWIIKLISYFPLQNPISSCSEKNVL